MNYRMWSFLLVLLASVTTVGARAVAAEIAVKEVKSSSTLPPVEGVTYGPENAIDHKAETFWVEGEAASGLGEWIQFDFADNVTIDRIEIRPGNFYNTDFWKRHNRIKEAQLKFTTGVPVRQEFPDKMEVQVIKLPAPIQTRFVRIVLKSVYAGTTFNDTCLSEVRFFGPGDDGRVDVNKATASTTYPDFEAPRVFDGMKDTLWCENAKTPGEGEWVQLTLATPGEIKGVRILNGTGSNESIYLRNNRAARVKVITEGGEVSADLPDTFGTWHELKFAAPVKATTVKVVIEGVTKGMEFNDACLAEIEVMK